MLGENQKALIKKWYCSPTSGYHMDVVYSDRYLNSRETGRGYPVLVKIIHDASKDVETVFEIARCEYEISCERKVEEITAYIASLDLEWAP